MTISKIDLKYITKQQNSTKGVDKVAAPVEKVNEVIDTVNDVDSRLQDLEDGNIPTQEITPEGGTLTVNGDMVVGNTFAEAAYSYNEGTSETCLLGGYNINGYIAYETITGPGAIDPAKYISKLETTGIDAFTLADGSVIGSLKKILMTVDGGNGTVTPTNLAGATTITFTAVGDFVLLIWNGTAWIILELGNMVDAVSAPTLA